MITFIILNSAQGKHFSQYLSEHISGNNAAYLINYTSYLGKAIFIGHITLYKYCCKVKDMSRNWEISPHHSFLFTAAKGLTISQDDEVRFFTNSQNVWISFNDPWLASQSVSDIIFWKNSESFRQEKMASEKYSPCARVLKI